MIEYLLTVAFLLVIWLFIPLVFIRWVLHVLGNPLKPYTQKKQKWEDPRKSKAYNCVYDIESTPVQSLPPDESMVEISSLAVDQQSNPSDAVSLSELLREDTEEKENH